jgi:CRP-like cAMP-binding protein
VDVYLGVPPARVGSVGEGESLGEVSALSGLAHSAAAVARDHVETAVLHRESLESLIRRRPDVGVVLFRNLATGLGEKLQRSDQALLEK